MFHARKDEYMSLYAIGDLHFSTAVNKPMDVFGDNWDNHQEKIINNWKEVISDEDTVTQVKERFYNKLIESREHDKEVRTTRYGIHKDDLNIFVNKLDVRLYGSQGQQRTASISQKLSEIELIKNEVGENPILILDDVFSELDETRQKLLVDNLEDVQMFITTAEVAHKSIFNKENTTIFNIEKGKVISIQNGGN